jgi:peptidyl-prolyl cis-trans isomerase SurA
LRVKTLSIAAAAVMAIFGFAACNTVSTSGGGGDDETAASVNGTDIPIAEVDRQIDAQIKAAGPNRPQLSPVDLAAARMQILDTLIQEEALVQRAQKEGVVPSDDELKQEIQGQKQKLGMTEEQFQKYLQTTGMTEDKFRQQSKRQLAIQKLRDKISAKVPTPTDAELRKFFDDNRSRLVAPRGVELSDIVVDPRPNNATDDATTPEAAERKVQEIIAALKAGNIDFATVARNRSEDPNTALQGGKLGFLAEAELQQTFPAEIVTRFSSMQPGQITEPIRANDGRWHIFKLDNRREQQQELTYEQVQQQIAQQITEQRKQIVLSALLMDVISAADVKNYLAGRILEHPDTFGALRPSPLTSASPAPASPAPPTNAAGPEAQPSAPAQPTNRAQPTTNR